MGKPSISNELLRLNQLKEKGIITQEEFDELKSKALGKDKQEFIEPETTISFVAQTREESRKKSGCVMALVKIVIVGFLALLALAYCTDDKKPVATSSKKQPATTAATKEQSKSDVQPLQPLKERVVPDSMPHLSRSESEDKLTRKYGTLCYDIEGYSASKKQVLAYAESKGKTLEELARFMNFKYPESLIDSAYMVGNGKLNQDVMFKTLDDWMVNRNKPDNLNIEQKEPICTDYSMY